MVNWINEARGNATAFDVTTKGILHAVFERDEFWRLRDAAGRPPGLMGWWSSRAVTFLENHDTVRLPHYLYRHVHISMEAAALRCPFAHLVIHSSSHKCTTLAALKAFEHVS